MMTTEKWVYLIVTVCAFSTIIGFFWGAIAFGREPGRCGKCVNCHTAAKHMPCERDVR